MDFVSSSFRFSLLVGLILLSLIIGLPSLRAQSNSQTADNLIEVTQTKDETSGQVTISATTSSPASDQDWSYRLSRQADCSDQADDWRDYQQQQDLVYTNETFNGVYVCFQMVSSSETLLQASEPLNVDNSPQLLYIQKGYNLNDYYLTGDEIEFRLYVTADVYYRDNGYVETSLDNSYLQLNIAGAKANYVEQQDGVYLPYRLDPVTGDAEEVGHYCPTVVYPEPLAWPKINSCRGTTANHLGSLLVFKYQVRAGDQTDDLLALELVLASGDYIRDDDGSQPDLDISSLNQLGQTIEVDTSQAFNLRQNTVAGSIQAYVVDDLGQAVEVDKFQYSDQGDYQNCHPSGLGIRQFYDYQAYQFVHTIGNGLCFWATIGNQKLVIQIDWGPPIPLSLRSWPYITIETLTSNDQPFLKAYFSTPLAEYQGQPINWFYNIKDDCPTPPYGRSQPAEFDANDASLTAYTQNQLIPLAGVSGRICFQVVKPIWRKGQLYYDILHDRSEPIDNPPVSSPPAATRLPNTGQIGIATVVVLGYLIAVTVVAWFWYHHHLKRLAQPRPAQPTDDDSQPAD